MLYGAPCSHLIYLPVGSMGLEGDSVVGGSPREPGFLSGNERNLAEVPPLTPCNVASVAEPHKFS